jgi:hypothetical protein
MYFFCFVSCDLQSIVRGVEKYAVWFKKVTFIDLGLIALEQQSNIRTDRVMKVQML